MFPIHLLAQSKKMPLLYWQLPRKELFPCSVDEKTGWGRWCLSRVQATEWQIWEVCPLSLLLVLQRHCAPEGSQGTQHYRLNTVLSLHHSPKTPALAELEDQTTAYMYGLNKYHDSSPILGAHLHISETNVIYRKSIMPTYRITLGVNNFQAWRSLLDPWPLYLM